MQERHLAALRLSHVVHPYRHSVQVTLSVRANPVMQLFSSHVKAPLDSHLLQKAEQATQTPICEDTNP